MQCDEKSGLQVKAGAHPCGCRIGGGGELVFERRLAKEGRLGLLRWTSLFLGIAGTYRQNDSVDVVYDVGGRRFVATGLPIIQDETGDTTVGSGGSRADDT